MSFEVLVLRHGETDHNLANRLQGQAPVPLNDRGRLQARALAGALRASGRLPTLLVTSDLPRALETARILAAELGLPEPEPDVLWRARNLGAYEDHTRAELRAAGAPGLEAWLADPLENAPPGGESGMDQRRRVAAGLARLRDRHAGRHPLVGVVTHEGCLRAALALAGGATPSADLANGARVHLRARGSSWLLVGHDREPDASGEESR